MESALCCISEKYVKVDFTKILVEIMKKFDKTHKTTIFTEFLIIKLFSLDCVEFISVTFLFRNDSKIHTYGMEVEKGD